MSKKVLEQITKNFSNIKGGVGEIMGGKILNCEAKDIFKCWSCRRARDWKC